jgi:hypothetical protein
MRVIIKRLEYLELFILRTDKAIQKYNEKAGKGLTTYQEKMKVRPIFTANLQARKTHQTILTNLWDKGIFI